MLEILYKFQKYGLLNSRLLSYPSKSMYLLKIMNYIMDII